MYTLARDGLTRGALRSQIPSLVATLLVAETYYKFHSFTLEFLAALATWLVFDMTFAALLGLFGLVRAASSTTAEKKWRSPA
jgi:hypothetical protein